jgi:putative SOS response-associated peptidase YedK
MRVPSAIFADPRRRVGKRFLIGIAVRSPFAFGRAMGVVEARAVVQTFTILTTTPNGLCRVIPKHRPVILARPEWRARLGERDTDQLLAIVRSFPTESMDAYPVDSAAAISGIAMRDCWTRSPSRPDMGANLACKA